MGVAGADDPEQPGVATDNTARFFPPDPGVFLADDLGVAGLCGVIQ